MVLSQIMSKQIIEINNLTFYYGEQRGVENLSFKIEEGEIFGFLGQNGAGKTTSELYYLPDDPQQQTNLINSQCGIAQNLHTELIDFLQSVDTPTETVDSWRTSPC